MLNSKQKQLCDILLHHKETATLQDGSDAYLLRHLTPIRKNLIEWLDFSKDERVLELGASTGILTELLCERAKETRAVSEYASEGYINRLRNRNHKNLTIVAPKVESPLDLSSLPQPSLEDAMPEEEGCYDTVVIIDPKPALCDYLSTVAPNFDAPLASSGKRIHEIDFILSLLRYAEKMLTPEGRLIFAVTNRTGLQYFAGATDNVSPRLFDSIAGDGTHNGGFSLTKNAVCRAFEEAGFAMKPHFYYPTPDHVYPTQIFSEDYLPGVGDIRPTSACYERSRYRLFDEKKAFDALCQDGLFETFANSYLVVASPVVSDVVYSKYNNTRRDHFATRTSIHRKDDSIFVTKTPLLPVGQVHVDKLAENASISKNLYSNVRVADVTLEDGAAVFPFLHGKSFSAHIEAALDNMPFAVKRFNEFLNNICCYQDDRIVDFAVTDGFREVFGEIDYKGDAVEGANIDEIPDNFLLTKGGITLIDYEWVFPFAVPIAYLHFRSVYYFFIKNQSIIQPISPAAGDPNSDGGEAWFLELFGFKGEEVSIWKQMEDHFQEYVYGPGRRSFYLPRYEKTVWDINKFLNDVDDAAGEHDKLVADVLRHEDLLALRNYVPYFLKKKFSKPDEGEGPAEV